MAEGLSDNDRRYFEALTEDFWDLFVIAEDESIRRVSMPVRLRGLVVLLMRPSDTDPKAFDKEARTVMLRNRCGYAEAMCTLIEGQLDFDDILAGFERDAQDDVLMGRLYDHFKREQATLRKAWIQENGVAPEGLPLALD